MVGADSLAAAGPLAAKGLLTLFARRPKSVSLYLVDVLTVKEEVEGEATVTTTDGFFSLNSGCIVLGVLWLLAMRGPLQELQELPSSAWVVDHVKAEKAK